MSLIQSSASTSNSPATTSHTYNYTVASGTTLLLIVLAGRGISGTPTISSFVYAGSTKTAITNTNISSGSGNLRQAMYKIENPLAGTRTLVATWSESTNSRISVIAYSGATALITQSGVSTSATGVSSVSVTLPRASLSTDYVVDAIGTSNSRTLTAGTNQIELYKNQAIGSSTILRHSMSYSNTAGQTGMSWSSSDGTTDWVQSSVIVEEEISGNFFMLF